MNKYLLIRTNILSNNIFLQEDMIKHNVTNYLILLYSNYNNTIFFFNYL